MYLIVSLGDYNQPESIVFFSGDDEFTRMQIRNITLNNPDIKLSMFEVKDINTFMSGV